MSVIPDKAQAERQKKLEEWPRPTTIPCKDCGGSMHQTEKGSTTYKCPRCAASMICWTGFDDPAWF